MKFFNNKGKLYNNCYLGVPEAYDKTLKEVLYTVYDFRNYKGGIWMTGMVRGSVELALGRSGKEIIWIS